MFQTNSLINVLGAVILLAALGLVVRNPQIVTSGGTQFNRALGIAVTGKTG